MSLQEEIRELEKRFAQAPDSRLFLPLADALRRAGELERAIRLCREGLQRYGDFTSARVLLAECLAAMGELDQAERVFEELVELDSGNRMALNSLAEVAEQRGDSRKAESIRRRLAGDQATPADEDIQPAGEPAAVARTEDSVPAGEPYAKLGAEEFEAVEEPAEEEETIDIVTADPGSVFLTHTLADIYRMQGHYGKAYEIYSRLNEAASGDPEVERKLSEVRSRLEGGSPGTASRGRQAGAPGDRAADEPADIAHQAEDEFETRIDSIFHFLLGDETAAPAAVAAGPSPAGDDVPARSDFIDHLENWIGGIRHGEAG